MVCRSLSGRTILPSAGSSSKHSTSPNHDDSLVWSTGVLSTLVAQGRHMPSLHHPVYVRAPVEPIQQPFHHIRELRPVSACSSVAKSVFACKGFSLLLVYRPSFSLVVWTFDRLYAGSLHASPLQVTTRRCQPFLPPA